MDDPNIKVLESSRGFVAKRFFGALIMLMGALAAVSEMTGVTIPDLVRIWKPVVTATLSEEARLALRVRLRQLASDGSLSVDESRGLREYVASLKLEVPLAEQYLSEIEPRMLQAARGLQEGVALAAQERLPEARARFREAIRLDDESATAWASLGGAALELGTTAEAEAALIKALKLEPENYMANYNFGACLAAQNRGAAALDHLERALTLLLRGDAPPVFVRQALLDDLENNPHFSSLRSSARFAALIQRAHDDFR